MKRWGYARVSTSDQNLAVQREALIAAGCDTVLAEQVSGASRQGREKLQLVLEVIGRGDMLVVTKLDRLARNTVDMLELVREIGRKGAGFKSLAKSWACFEPAAKNEAGLNPMVELILTVMGGVAQFERARIRERIREGIDRAKRENPEKYQGRPPSFDAGEIRRLAAEGLSKSEIARRLRCHRCTVHRALEAATAKKLGQGC